MRPEEVYVRIDRVMEMHLDGARDQYQTSDTLQALYKNLRDGDEQRAFWGYLHQLARLEFKKQVKTLQSGRSLTPNVFGIVLRAYFGYYGGDLVPFLQNLLNLVSAEQYDPIRRQRSTDFLNELNSHLNYNWPPELLNLIESYLVAFRKKVLPSETTPQFDCVVKQLSDSIKEAGYRKLEAEIEAGVLAAQEPAMLVPKPDLPIAVAAALAKAEALLQAPSDQFDPKHAGDLLRTCMDEAHKAIVTVLIPTTGNSFDGTKDGQRRQFMRENGFITEPEDKFFSAIYTLISEEATHKLDVDKETALVMHLSVSAYIRLLFRRLAKWKPQQSTAMTLSG